MDMSGIRSRVRLSSFVLIVRESLLFEGGFFMSPGQVCRMHFGKSASVSGSDHRGVSEALTGIGVKQVFNIHHIPTLRNLFFIV